MKPLNDNLTLQRLSGYVINEVQKSHGLALTTRLRVDTDNHIFWMRSGEGMKVMPMGVQTEYRAEAPIEITFDYECEKALVWVDDIRSLVRPERLFDFDLADLPDAPVGEIEVEVNLTEGLERLPIWKSLPPNPQNNPVNRPVRVVGGFK